MSWNPRKEPFTKKVPLLPGAGEVWHKRYLEGNDFTSDLGVLTLGEQVVECSEWRKH